LQDNKLHLVGIAQQVLGDFVCQVDLKAHQLAVLIHVGERGGCAVSPDDDLVALQHDIELRFLCDGRNSNAGERNRQQHATHSHY